MGRSGQLTTHVLDISGGKPAAGMKVQLWKRDADRNSSMLKDDRLNADGRLDVPLLSGDGMVPGVYEIVFEAGDYFREVRGIEPLLFDQIPIRFTVEDVQSHYHVPLLVAPGGYSTYRGS
ncbi:hydroxyisourate hydrolase [Cohnella lupini]|uniref:5-hydroxyisourate hydrolase n=1 Tax=Cohnella lupini TaxID=1294267 RepID=A0A3D9IVX0_9BACL|nr:hydroxyisourate hydrolase [Cohnella lupini]RED65988.1 5-hydroxyisourate hydrolase [Cohnella lupini]